MAIDFLYRSFGQKYLLKTLKYGNMVKERNVYEEIVEKLVNIERSVDSVTESIRGDIFHKLDSLPHKFDNLDRIADTSKKYFLVFLTLYIFFEITVIVAFLSLIFS